MDRLKVDSGARSYEIIIGSGVLKEPVSAPFAGSGLPDYAGNQSYGIDLYGEQLRGGLGVDDKRLVWAWFRR